MAGEDADALPTRPAIVSRSEWGATMRKGGCKPRTGPVEGTVKAAVIHHTATANDYTAAEGAGDRARHLPLSPQRQRLERHRLQRTRRPLRDALRRPRGRHQEGDRRCARAGLQRPDDEHRLDRRPHRYDITAQAKASIVNYLAWKLSVHGLSAIGKTTLTSAGGDLSRYPAGRKVRLNKVIGHRDVGLTACPGETLEQQVPPIRRMVQARIEASGGPAPPPPTDPTDPTDPTSPGGGVSP